MARKGTINEFYDIAALRAQHQTAIQFVEEFIDKVAAVKPIAVSLQGANKTGDILKGIQDITKAQADYSAASAKAAKAADIEARARERNAKAAQTEAKTADLSAKAKEREEKSRINNQKAIDREAAARAKEEKQIEAALNDYLSLSKAYQEAALKAKTYYLTLGENHPITVQAVKDAKDMDTILKRVDASVGQYNRNVGNYSSAFNGLSTSFGQLARELPALAINASTFFLAISNNLPMFIDEVQRAKVEIAGLRAEGKAAPSLFQALSKAIFSFNTVMVLAVTALTLFGGKIVDWIGSLFKGSDAVNFLIKDLDRLNSEFEEGDRRIKAFGDNLDFLAAKRRIDIEIRYLDDPSMATIKNLGKDTSDLYDKFGQLNNELLKTKQAFSDIEFETLRALQADENFSGQSVADALGMGDEDIEKLEENTQKALKTFRRIYDRRQDQEREALRLSQQVEINQKQMELERARREKEQEEKAKERAKKAKDYAVQERRAAYELAKLKIQDEIALQDALAKSGTGSGGSTSARARQLEAEKKLILLTKEFELSQENVTAKEKELIRETANRALLAAEGQMVVDLISIRKKLNERVKAEGQAEIDAFARIQEEKKQKQAGIAEQGFERSLRQIQRLADAEETALNNNYRAGLIKKEDYEKKKQDIENRARAASLQAEINFYEYLFNLYEFDAKAQEEYLTKIADLRKQLSGIGLKTAKDDAAEMKRVLQDLATEIRGLTFDLFTGAIERQKNALQEQMDLLEQRKQKDIETENARIQSTQDRAAAISIIEARAAAEKEQLQQRQRKLDVEKAKFDKANAITGIIQNTALAVMKAAPNFVLQAVVAALGAVQIARVLAQPIPKYAEGTKDHPGGKAIVGDGGKKELILTPDGRYMITKDTAHTVDMPRHSIVLPDAEAALLHSNSRQTVTVKPVFQQPNHSLQKEFRQLRRTIQDKRENYFKFPSPVDHYMKSGESWTRIRKG